MLNLLSCLIRQEVGLLMRLSSISFGDRFLHTQFIFSKKHCSSFELPRNISLLRISNARYYAKGRDIIKEKKKNIKICVNEINEYFDSEKLLADLAKPLEYFKEELVKHATLRTSPNAIESIMINFEGHNYTIRDLAEVGKKSRKFYVLDFGSFPAVIPTVIKTLQQSELNLNVSQEGEKVVVPIPNVTKEYREVLAKKAKSYFHKCKESIRKVEITYKKRLDNIEKLPTEVKFRITEQLTALGDKHIQAAEEVLKAKHQELLA